MELTVFHKKINKLDGQVYVIEEEIPMPENGIYDANLLHDNVNESTLTVYSGSKLAGEPIETYALSTPSLTPWKRTIRIQSQLPAVYICYETEGDMVEADDINHLQEAVTETQKALTETQKAVTETQKVVTETQKALNEETERAKEAEKEFTFDLQSEAESAVLRDQSLDNRITQEADRAKAAEQNYADKLSAEVERASLAETLISNTITAHKPSWDEAYNQSHTHENKSITDKITQAMIDLWNSALTTLPIHKHPKADITDFPLSLPANGGNADTVNGHSVNTDVPAGAKFTDTTYSHPASGAAAGTYKSVTINAQGHVTGGSNPVTLAGYGITDAAASKHNHDSVYLKKGAMIWNDLKGV